MEDELAESRGVVPLGRGGRVGDRVRQASRIDDRRSDRREPAGVGSDDRGERRGRAPEGGGDPRQTNGRPGGVGVHASFIGGSTPELHSFFGGERAGPERIRGRPRLCYPSCARIAPPGCSVVCTLT